MAEELRIVVDDWAHPQDAWIMPLPVLPDTPDLSGLLGGLPDASGEFTGTFDSGGPALVPVELSGLPPGMPVPAGGMTLTFACGSVRTDFLVVRTEVTGPGAVRVWCRYPEDPDG